MKSWISWGTDSGVHPAVLRFVSQTPDIFAASESNPRSWAYVSDLLRAYQSIGLSDENLLLITLAGVIGDSLATAFVQASLREEESIPADMILREYEKARTTVRQWVKEKRMDLLNSTVHGVMVSLQNVDTASEVASGATLSRNLGLFIDDLPADLGKKLKKAAKVTGAIP